MTSRDMEIMDLHKCKIRFTSPEGDYEGTVRIVCPVVKKIVVSPIIFLPKRISLGSSDFKFHEIRSYTILSRPDASEIKNVESKRSTYSYAPPRAKDMSIFDDYSEAGDDEIENEVNLKDLLEEEEFELKIPPQLASRIPMDNVVIDRIDDEFHQAIKHILQQDSIGISLEGPKIGRNGILSWFCVATSSCTFLFDIETLKEGAFKEGLKKVLENPNIEKVLHDCRQASDCLFHKFHTRLVNVFDTQVADFLVSMQRSKDCKVTKHVSSLDSCLRNYLEIPEEYIHKPKVYRTYEDSVVFFRLRPLQSDKRQTILKNVVYLRTLKRELNFALLTPLHRGVEVYLQVLQTATDRELLLEPSVPEKLPQELVMEGIQIVRFKEFVDVSPVVASGPPYRKLNNPIRDYADHCATNDLRSRSKIECSRFVKDHKDQCNANIKLADYASPHRENSSHCVESNTDSLPDDISSANAITTAGMNKKCTKFTKNTQKCSPQFKNNSDSSNLNTNVYKTKGALAEYLSFVKKRRMHQLKENLQSLNLSEKSPKSEYTQSQCVQDSSDDYSGPEQSEESYQDIVKEVQDNQRHILPKETNSLCSSSEDMDSGDDNVWAAMRSAFNTCDYSAETVKRKIRFYPA